MAIKAENQYYGKGFEQTICALFNKNVLKNPYPDHIKEEDYQQMIKHAKNFLASFENKVSKINSIS